MSRFNQTALFISAGLLIVVITAVLLMCAVPPVSRDALTHHLAVPKLYLAHGGIYEIPSIEFSYYPMNLDLLYLASLYLGTDIAPKYIHFAFALFTALLIFFYLKQELDILYALLGVIFFLTIPVIIKLSITVYVDLGLIFFTTAALLALLRWKKSGFKPVYLFVSAISCGLAMGTKYNGLIVFFCLVMFVPLIFLRCEALKSARSRKAPVMATIYMATALLVFSPWMVKNFIWTGNPIYPLYNNWFNSVPKQPATSLTDMDEDDLSVKKEKMKWNHFQLRRFIYKESALETLFIPLRIFFQGEDDNPKYFDGRLNPFLFFLPLVAILGIQAESEDHIQDIVILFAFTVLYLLFVFVQTDMRIRWVSPIIPSLAIISMFGVRRLILCANMPQIFNKWIVVGVICIAVVLPLGINLSYIYKQYKKVGPWEYISGKVSRSEYITRYRPEYSAIAYANKTLTPQAKILALYLGNRIYYSDHRMDCNYSPFYKKLETAASEQELYNFLINQGFTHLLIRFDLLQHRIDTILSAAEKEVLKKFFENFMDELYVGNGHGLFALSDRRTTAAE